MQRIPRKILAIAGLMCVVFFFSGVMSMAGTPDDLTPRVPPESLKKAQSLQNPLTPSPDLIAKGKKIYEGQAYCSACHGLEGAKGSSGKMIVPSETEPPTNFADAAWQATRTDGELFWILKHGSHGTDMAPYLPLYLTEDDAWTVVLYLRTFGGV